MNSVGAIKRGMTRVHQADGCVQAVSVLELETIFKDKPVIELKYGQVVFITGKGKGKGFSGTIKRYNFSRGPMSHGSHNKRQPGSIGATYPQRVIKGRPMPGRHGNRNSTKKTVVEAFLPTEQLVYVRGSVPGSRGTKLLIKFSDEN